jgi:hypothetical protein
MADCFAGKEAVNKR